MCETGGGPNGAALGPDGALYVCNNGGFEWHTNPDGSRHVAQRMPEARGRIERIDLATGKCTTLYDRAGDFPLSSPNDIVFDTDGGYVIPVGYGLESHWVQIVLAGGPATIHKHGKTVQVANPRLVSKAEAAQLVTSSRLFFRLHPYNEAALVLTAR